jgi:hypothetical protein
MEIVGGASALRQAGMNAATNQKAAGESHPKVTDLFIWFREDLSTPLMILRRCEFVGAVKISESAESVLFAGGLGLIPFTGLNLAECIERTSMNAIKLWICGDRRDEWVNRGSGLRSRGAGLGSCGCLLRLGAFQQGLASAILKFLRIRDIRARGRNGAAHSSGGTWS